MTTVKLVENVAPGPGDASFLNLMTPERWIEIGRILLTGAVALLYWQQLVPLYLLWAAVALGLYPLVKTGLIDLFTERKIGTEIFVTIATLVAVFGGETVAGAVLMVIILIAEFIAELNTDRARASIKSLIGSVPQTALVREGSAERIVPIGLHTGIAQGRAHGFLRKRFQIALQEFSETGNTDAGNDDFSHVSLPSIA